MGAKGFAFLGSSQNHLEHTWQGSTALGGSDSFNFMFVSVAVSTGARFDDFTMSVPHLSFYSNRARHELYMLVGSFRGSVCIDFPPRIRLYFSMGGRWAP